MWLTGWSEQKTWKVKRGRKSEVWAFSSQFFLPPSPHSGWRLWHGTGPGWRSVKPLREEMTGLPQAPLCSSNGLLRRHGGVRNIISSYSPHETFFFFFRLSPHLAVLPFRFLNGSISFTQRIRVLSVKSKAITQLTSHLGSLWLW